MVVLPVFGAQSPVLCILMTLLSFVTSHKTPAYLSPRASLQPCHTLAGSIPSHLSTPIPCLSCPNSSNHNSSNNNNKMVPSQHLGGNFKCLGTRATSLQESLVEEAEKLEYKRTNSRELHFPDSVKICCLNMFRYAI